MIERPIPTTPPTISHLDPVPLHELWKNEAHHFTRWLADNLDLLGEKLGLTLTLVQREIAAGAFSADILAEDGQGNSVLIENQLEATDHEHLGKLITYMSNLNAKIAIWITSTPRPEHETAVHWLNEALPADTAFYLVKLEAFRINGSLPAPHFTIVAGPTAAARDIGEQKKVLAEGHHLRLAFWQQLLERAKARTLLHSRVSPASDHWISASAGRTGLGWNYVILRQGARVELYIDVGDSTRNKALFDQLQRDQVAIEAHTGPLLWQRLDDRRSCRIAQAIPIGGLTDRASWPTTQDAMIAAMIQLEQTLGPYLARIGK